MIGHINNSELGLSVRTKLNQVIDFVDAYNAAPPTLADILGNDNKTGGFDITSDDGNSVASIVDGEILLYSGTTNAGLIYLAEAQASMYTNLGGFFSTDLLLPATNYFQVKTAANVIKHGTKNTFDSLIHEFNNTIKLSGLDFSYDGNAEGLVTINTGDYGGIKNGNQYVMLNYNSGYIEIHSAANSKIEVSSDNGGSITLTSPVINYGVAASQHFFLGTDLKYNGLNVATENYVDNLISGLKFKQDVVVASTANVNVSAAPTSIDSVTLTVGDRVLLKDQTNATQNGVYVFMGFGQALVRATDSNAGDELVSATYPVRSGTVNQDTWFTITNDSITIGTTNITFSQVAGAGTYTVGSYLKLTGNVFDIDFSTFSTTQITEGTNLYFTDARARTAVIASSITNGDTTHSPNGDVIFDALALKANITSPIFLTEITTPIINLGEAAARQWRMATRSSVTTFPVPFITPNTSGASIIAFDLMPKGSPSEDANGGFAWIDIVDTDCSTTNPALQTARIGIHGTYVEFGSRSFNGGTVKPLSLQIEGTRYMTMATNGNTTFDNGANAGTYLRHTNNNAGSSAYSEISTSASALGTMRTYGNGFTFDSNNFKNKTEIGNNSAGVILSANGASGAIEFITGSTAMSTNKRMTISASGNVSIGKPSLATTATDGFPYIPTCAGTPTGAPTAITGFSPVVIDSTNNKMYFYSGGAWVALN